ncbi:MAG TPA: FkbM family methyltransferase [Verrucomicrobiae bacterium]|nr:FkbM family methyltransferase [Verrucomicrobiae bacterium]
MHIGYAQNGEDVMLRRCFAGGRAGFYIDVGAMHPLIDSVTFSFYESGWRGVNVEPNPGYHQLLARFRPRDVNLNLALADVPGEATLTIVENTGLSSLDPENGVRAMKLGHTTSVAKVNISTLERICEEFAPRTIDFLKVDVEGWEERVLQGGDWRRFRPRVVLVEATEPNSQVPSWAEWDPLLRKASYRFVYFDGLNRFYVAEEHEGLAQYFETPPGFFDTSIGFREAALHDALCRGSWQSWRNTYRRRMEALAMRYGDRMDEGAYLTAWPAEAVEAEAKPEDVDRCYLEILGRPAEKAGRNQWIGRIASEHISVRQLVREFLHTDEYLGLRLRAEFLP